MQLLIRDKAFYKKLVTFALPIALQSVIMVGVNLADNVMLGQLGEVAMSSATLANNFISIFQISCMGLGMGASVLVSRYFGMRDQVSIKKAVNIMFRLEFVFALLFSLATLFFPGKIMSLYSTEEGVIAGGTGYLLISVPCYFLNGYATTTSLMLRSVGKANIPLYSSIAAFFINIFFNWLFIFGNLGAPRMEVNGAALGTLLARVVEFSVTMGFLLLKDKNIGFRVKDLTMKVGDMIPEYLRICLPVLASDAFLGIGNSATAAITGHISSAYVAANVITTITMQVSTIVMSGLSQASCAITGITLGEGNIEKAQRQGVTFATLGFLIGGVSCALILLIKWPIISLYRIEPETRALANQLMNALALTIWFQSANMILTKGTLRGGGDTRFLMIIDIICLWMICIPFGYMAALVWKWPAFYIYIVLRCDAVIKSILSVFRLKSGKWIKRIGAR